YTTMAPNVAVINVPPGTTTNTITLTVGAIAEGADSYDVYRRGPGDPTFYLIANATSTAFVDNGTYPPDCTKTRPARNDTNSFNSVLISLDELDTPLAPGIASWRIYRSTSPSFGSNS